MKKLLVILSVIVFVFATFNAVNWSGEIFLDHFEDGNIDSNLWAVGGSTRAYYGGPGGSWEYLNDEVVSSDGYLRNQVTGPTSANTYGAEAWVRTHYDFNDGTKYTINFTWGPVVFDPHYNVFSIQITDGIIDPNWDNHWVLREQPEAGSFLYTASNPNYSKENWSIVIEPSGIATLFDSPNATGNVIRQVALDHDNPWYIRFVVVDATSSGFPGGGAELRLYDFQAIEVALQIDIDIKPGSDPNCFNLNGHGVIPVAINGAEDLDVYNIDIESLSFGGLSVRVRGHKGPLCSTEDWNEDGYIDLVCHFEDEPDNWTPGGDTATLTGFLLDGRPIEGIDSICIVPNN